MFFSESFLGILRVYPGSYSSTAFSYPYARNGQEITVDSPPVSSYLFQPFTIVQLTNDTLELQQEVNPPNGVTRSVIGGYYTR